MLVELPEILVIGGFVLAFAFLLMGFLFIGELFISSPFPALVTGIIFIMYIPYTTYMTNSYDPPELRAYIQEEIYPDKTVEIERLYGPIGEDGINYVIAEGDDISKVTVSREKYHGKRAYKIERLNE